MPKSNVVLAFSKNLIAFFLLLGCAYLLFIIVRAVFQYLAGLNDNLLVAIIAATATVLVSVISVVVARLYEARAIRRRELNEKKLPLYDELLGLFFDLILNHNTEDSIASDELARQMTDINKKVILWASDNVIVAWVRLRKTLLETKSEQQVINALLAFEQLILEIRKDLGHKNKKIFQKDVLSLIINDINKLPSHELANNSNPRR